MLAGVIPPLITPLLDRDTLDTPGLTRLLDHVITGGVHAIFILGTSGELAGLSPRLRRELIDRTLRHVNARVPVLVGVTDTFVGESISLARHAAETGAAAVVVTVPYFLPPDQAELQAYVRTILDEQPLPVILYNIPQLTKVAFEPDTVLRLAGHDRVIGLKDSSGDLAYLHRIASRLNRAHFRLFLGVEHLYTQAASAGFAHGVVAGGANVAPQLFVALHDALRQGHQDQIIDLQKRVELLGQIYQLDPGMPSFIRGMKTALSCLGICSPRPADPFRPHSPAQQDQIRNVLRDLSLLA
jgi:4-hydroxy-tetrahydrodipicolinate synthase